MSFKMLIEKYSKAVMNTALRIVRDSQNAQDVHQEVCYAGKGVKLGDADKAVFWYRPEGSGTYRVIYGDLKAADVAPEKLPQ